MPQILEKYYSENYFLTFKCYCFPSSAAVLLLPCSFRSMAGLDRWKRERACREGVGDVVVFIETPEPERLPPCAVSWTDHKCINNWVCLKKPGCVGGIKNFMACHYGSPTPLPPPAVSPPHWSVSLTLRAALWRCVPWAALSHSILLGNLSFKGALAVLQPHKGHRKGNMLHLFLLHIFWQTSSTHGKALEGSLSPALKPRS